MHSMYCQLHVFTHLFAHTEIYAVNFPTLLHLVCVRLLCLDVYMYVNSGCCYTQ